MPPIAPESKFARIEFDNYASGLSVTLNFSQFPSSRKADHKIWSLPEAFDAEAAVCRLTGAAAPANLFQAIWLEVGAKPPLMLNDAKMLAMLDSRAVAANQFNDGAGQLHFAFDIDDAGFSRVALFNIDIPPSRMGRAVQRVVELETYRLLALGFAAVRDNGGRLGEIEDIVGKLTNELVTDQLPTARWNAAFHIDGAGC